MPVTRFWKTGNSLQLHDERTNTRTLVVVPYAEEAGFYSPDELEEIIEYAVEDFTVRCAEKPPHVVPTRDWQHGLGQTLEEIKCSRENRKELGGPKYHQLIGVSNA